MNDRDKRIINSNFKRIAKFSPGRGQTIDTPSYVTFGGASLIHSEPVGFLVPETE